MQHTPTDHTARGPFSTRYLEAHLPETDAWEGIETAELRTAYDDIDDRWGRETAGRNEGERRGDAFARSVLRTLGFSVDGRDDRPGSGPGDGVADDATATRDAFERLDGSGDCDAVAVATVGEGGRPHDASARSEREFEIAGYRIHEFLRDASARWAVLTNGRRWRLYHAATSHRPDAYYEIDLPRLLARGDREAFEYFYRFFRREAFREDATGECFLDAVADGSDDAARDLVRVLEENAREALEVLVEGFLDHPDNELDERDLELLSESALVYLYRLLVVNYAEGTGRCPLDPAGEPRGRSSGPSVLERAVGGELDRTNPADGDHRGTLQSRLDGLFARIDAGTASGDALGAKRRAPAPGWLFRTDPEPDGRRELRFLAAHAVDDATLATVVDLVTRRPPSTGSADGAPVIDYASLDARHLGSLYERLLEYEPAIADEPLALDGGEYVPAGVADDVAVEPGEAYLATDGGERKATGSYYTPEHVVSYVVERTLEPLVAEIRDEARARHAPGEPGFAEAVADRVLELTVLDPAMGCGHFLTRAVDYLAREIVDARATRAARTVGETGTDGPEPDIRRARRRVVRRCLYGVDCDPLAVELARVSLWLRTRGSDRPVESLERHLRTGNALVGSDLEWLDDPAAASDGPDGDGTAAGSPDDGGRQTGLRDRLEAIANVRTAREFGLEDVPADAVDRLTAALGDDDAWERVARATWFETAQTWADAEGCFHWPLAFPEVCRGEDGTGRDAPGFDAVVGNPPWVATAGRADISAAMEPDLRSYLADAFEAAEGQFDLGVALYEQAIRRSRDGRVGIVVPDSILAREQHAPLREFVLEHTSLSRIVRVGTAFPGVETGAVVCVSGGSDGAVRCADATDRSALESPSYRAVPQRVFERREASRFLIHLDAEARSILATVDRRPPLAAYAAVSRGEEIGKRADLLAADRRPDRRPIAPGGAVERYGLETDELRYIRPDDVAKDEGTYRSPKLVFRQTGESLVGTYDDAGLATIKSAYTVHAESASSDELKHLLGVLNSPLLNFYHHYTHAAYRAVFPQINQSTVEALPVAMDGGPDRPLVERVDERLERTAERSGLSPDVLDHLGEDGDGRPLSRLGDCRRAEGSSASKLAATTEEWPNLRLGGVDATADRSSVALSATVRYKPDDERLETDRWGYAETEPIPALEVDGVEADLAVLVSTFVPAAVERGRGFAGFRSPATKTTSPLERLEALRLPRLEGVAGELRAFRRERARAEKLDERIAALDRRIADRVFDLYGLPRDQRERVRREFGAG